MFDVIVDITVLATFALLLLLCTWAGLRISQIYEVPNSAVWQVAAGIWIAITFVLLGLHWVIVDRLFGLRPMAWGAAVWMLWTWSRMADVT